MRIGIDLDGVCYDFVAALRHWLVTSENADPDDLPDAECWDFFSEQWGLTLDQFKTHCAAGVDEGVIFLWGEPLAQTAWAFESLRGMGHTLHLVTDRFFGRKSQANTVEWLTRHDLPYDSLTFSTDKTIVRVDAFIDDKPSHVRDLIATGCNAILRDRPHNRDAHDVPRVASWADFVLAVEKHSDAPTETVLQEAQRLVHGDRGVDYGHPADDFTRTGRMWGAILGTPDVAPDRVGLCMAALKISREVNAHKRDNLTDLAGYAETVSMVHDR